MRYSAPRSVRYSAPRSVRYSAPPPFSDNEKPTSECLHHSTVLFEEPTPLVSVLRKERVVTADNGDILVVIRRKKELQSGAVIRTPLK